MEMRLCWNVPGMIHHCTTTNLMKHILESDKVFLSSVESPGCHLNECNIEDALVSKHKNLSGDKTIALSEI